MSNQVKLAIAIQQVADSPGVRNPLEVNNWVDESEVTFDARCKHFKRPHKEFVQEAPGVWRKVDRSKRKPKT